jgi:hypothetical protein
MGGSAEGWRGGGGPTFRLRQTTPDFHQQAEPLRRCEEEDGEPGTRVHGVSFAKVGFFKSLACTTQKIRMPAEM